MDAQANWVLPLILLPGIALLIVSTATRYGQLHGEVHHLVGGKHSVSSTFIEHLRRRARLFRNALVALYISVGLFALGGLLGGLEDIMRISADTTVGVFTGAGVGAVVYASFHLIQESTRSLIVIEEHIEEVQVRPES